MDQHNLPHSLAPYTIQYMDIVELMNPNIAYFGSKILELAKILADPNCTFFNRFYFDGTVSGNVKSETIGYEGTLCFLNTTQFDTLTFMYVETLQK